MEKLIVKLRKGGDTIGFSFCIHNDYGTSCNSVFFENKNTDYQL